MIEDKFISNTTTTTTTKMLKPIAEIIFCGCIHFCINDTHDFIMPTEEQRKNLKDLFCIEVIPADDASN